MEGNGVMSEVGWFFLVDCFWFGVWEMGVWGGVEDDDGGDIIVYVLFCLM